MKLTRVILAGIFAMFVMLGCAEKQGELYNKSAMFWYKQIVKDIKDLNLESADNHYTSMSSEHVGSPLLEPVLLILAEAHIENEEYLLANFYLDTYMKRFGTYKKNEYAKYMKIKANFLSFTSPNRNQELLLSTIRETRKYVDLYPKSMYTPMVETILVKMELGNYYLDEQIKSLYNRTDRPYSAEIYKKQLEENSLKDAKMIEPQKPWYREIFE